MIAYRKALKYCESKKKYVVKKRSGGGSWSWSSRKAWMTKNLGTCGCWKICAAKWNMLRLKDAHEGAKNN